MKKELKNLYVKWNQEIRERFGWNSNLPRRRTTAMTNLRSSVAVVPKNKPTTVVADEAFS